MTENTSIFSDPRNLNQPSEAFQTFEKEQEQEDSDKTLTQEGSEYFTEVSRDLWGQDMPEVLTTEDVESLEDLSKDQLLEESALVEGQRIAEGTATVAEVQQEAIRQAHRLNSTTVLAENIAREDVVKASLENAMAEISQQEELQQTNVNTFNNVLMGLTEGSQLYSVLTSFVPGKYQDETRDTLRAFGGEPAGFFSQEEALRNLSSILEDKMQNLPPEEFSKFLSESVNYLRDKGYSDIQIKGMLRDAHDPMYTLSAISSAADVFAIGGGVKASVQAGARGGIGSLVSEAAIQGVEAATPFGLGGPVLRKTGEAIDAVFKGSKVRTRTVPDPMSREGALETIGRTEEAGRLSKAKTDALPDSEIRSAKVLDHQASDITRPVKSLVDNAADSKYIKTQAALDRATDNIIDFIRNQGYGQSLDQLNNELITDLIQKTARTYDTQVLPNQRTLGNYIEAIDTDDVLFARGTGDITFRVRMPDVFKTQEEATEFAKGLSSSNNIKSRVMKAPTGFKVEVDVETHQGLGDLMVRGRRKDWRPTASSVFTHSSNPSDIKQVMELNDVDRSMLRDLMGSLETPYKKLNRKDKTIVDDLLQRSQDELSWKRPEELDARGFSKEVQQAYNSARIANDVDYFIMNRAERADRIRRGIRRLTYGTQEIGEGAIVRDPTIEKLSQRKLAIGSLSATPKNISQLDTDQIKQMIDSKEWSVVELTQRVQEGLPARNVYYLLKSDQVLENDLPEFVLPYLPGGRRFFDRRSTFIKQHIIAEGETGTKAVTGIRTFFADLDETGTVRLAEKLEAVRQKFVQGASEFEINKAITEADFPANRIKNAQDFRDFATANGMDLVNANNTVEAVKNGRALRSFDVLTKTDNMEDLIGIEEMPRLLNRSAFQALSNEQRLRKLHRSGRELYTLDFNRAQVVDFEKQLHYMVTDMVQNGVMRHFTDYYASRFVKAFGDVMDNTKTAKNYTDVLLRGKPLQGLTGKYKDLAEAAETAQKNYMLIRGTPSKVDQIVADAFDRWLRSAGVTAEKTLHIPEKLAHWVRVNYAQIDKASPLNLVRSFTSHVTMGMLDYTQLMKQAASSIYVFGMHPVAAAKGARYWPVLTSLLFKTDGNIEKLLAETAKRFGDSPDEISTIAKNLGKMHIVGETSQGGLVDIANMTSNVPGRTSMIFVKAGEMFNRVVAATTALEINGFTNKALTSAKDLARVRTDFQKLFLNMDATGLSRVQSGPIAKLATQLFGYQMRLFEAVVPGLNKEMTAKERSSLILTMLALTGARGVFGESNVLDNALNFIMPDETFGEEFKERFSEGLLGMLGKELNIDLTAPLSMNLFDITERLSDINGLNLPAITTIKNTADMIQYIARACFEETAPTSYEEFSNFLSSILAEPAFPKVLKRPLFAWTMWNTGNLFNSKGALQSSDNNKLAAVLYGMGFNTYDQKVLQRSWREYQEVKGNRDALTKELTKLMSNYWKNDDQISRNIAYQVLKDSDFDTATRGEILKEAVRKASDGQISTPLQKNFIRELKARGVYGTNSIEYMLNKKEKD